MGLKTPTNPAGGEPLIPVGASQNPGGRSINPARAYKATRESPTHPSRAPKWGQSGGGVECR